ncbi:hypothetical protein [Streptomyces showdoensis]|uniref:Uncharacterized protein n=1 Tax=Streptomyces showdoensis TaxID=68268 RepID=A0A2P2GT36_STREW|nr:hypothetical protein [Streptomyces showdoensis]KKZ74646.1 hypothetical protein VO63_06030 [Streptomyces showdoensis]
MSAQQNAGVRKTVRQFALALVACLAVAGGASLAAADDSGAAQQQNAGVTNEWPFVDPTPTPTPTN